MLIFIFLIPVGLIKLCNVCNRVIPNLYILDLDLSPDGELFVDEKQSAPLMHDCEIMAKACFYGSLHGFQVSRSGVYNLAIIASK